MVVRNPDVPKDSPFLKIAQENGAKIEMESSIFFEELPSSKTIGITGTKGKTTTTMLVYQMLKEAGEKVVIGGNLEISLLELLPRLTRTLGWWRNFLPGKQKGLKFAKNHLISPLLPIFSLTILIVIKRWKNMWRPKNLF